MMVCFYASPIFYPDTMVPRWLKPLYYLNPMAGIVHSFRSILFYGRPPSGAIFLYTSLVAILVMVGGYRTFKRYEPLYADLV